MNLSDIPLRELKKARNKVALYEASLSLIGEKMFREVMLDDICRKAEVSRVTFFKYFQKKEDLLLYFMRVWLTERIIEIKDEDKSGFSSVRHLLHKVADQNRERPGLMPSLISFLVEMKMHPCMPEMSRAETLLLFPNHEDIGAQTPNMFDLFHRCMTEAKRNGKLKNDITLEMAVQVLFTVFYGAFLTAQLYDPSEVLNVYDAHLQLIENS
ncbi:TetR/AcrR family transcriptional regulator [Paenibacillus sp. N1-5-1-14]|uniref:TetR/AcrR family transcriptional regulator n=1 Tax=Paenibacillus radicibacter TaxID=2972488 RepID=UPI002158BB35|nr:TetR/AcrR family transcriptional regulator [Paenibacillus radicibacter]MCR8645507.1 TetR/AcrR family transcriptional regulator [Paenibacillus radicibacter]